MNPPDLWDEIVNILEMERLTSLSTLQGEVSGVFCGDLLSDVLANAQSGQIWITIQKHLNVVAIANLVGISGVIVTGKRIPESEVIKTAEEKGVPFFSTPFDNFWASGRLYKLLEKKEILPRL